VLLRSCDLKACCVFSCQEEGGKPAATLVLVLELLCFCVGRHAYRIKYYILRNHVVEATTKPLLRREPWVGVAVVRFLRTCVGLKVCSGFIILECKVPRGGRRCRRPLPVHLRRAEGAPSHSIHLLLAVACHAATLSYVKRASLSEHRAVDSIHGPRAWCGYVLAASSFSFRLQDDFYNRYLVRHNLFEPVIQAFLANGPRYNLLNRCETPLTRMS
jgi:hypothetical protein